MASLAELRVLYKRRELIELKLKNIEEFLKRFEVGDSVCQVKVRAAEMPKIREDHESVCLDIMLKEGDDENINETIDYSQITAFESRWYDAHSKLQALCETISITSNSRSQSPVHDMQTNVRLPVISLPEFSGEYKEWLPFFDAFNSLIHENRNLNDCQKFHYLKSSLKGEASRSVESLTISHSNYSAAWSILQKRYNNKRLIVQSHVKSILNTPQINKSSSEALRKLVDDVTSNIEALRVLTIPVDSCDVFVNAIIIDKLDYNTRKEFENILNTEIPTRAQLVEFLEKKCNTLESMRQSVNVKPPAPANHNNVKKYQPTYRTAHVAAPKFSCHYCKRHHYVTNCNEFLALTIDERRKQVAKRSLCFSCLRDDHDSSVCKALSCCKICNEKSHHTLLHKDAHHEAPLKVMEVSSSNHCSKRSEQNVVLSTAIILVKDSTGKYHKCRCLLDVGSQLNLLSNDLCRKLNLKVRQSKMTVLGVGGTCSQISETADISIESIDGSYRNKISCYLTKQPTTNIPVNSFNISYLRIPESIDLADPEFNLSKPIDLILNAEIFWNVLCTERLIIANTNIHLARTRLGWIIGGAIKVPAIDKSSIVCKATIKPREDIKEIMERFWVQEEIVDSGNVRSVEEINCENHFLKTVTRDRIDRRFIIKLPFKNDNVGLGDSSKTAINRFISLERRFRKDSEFKKNYVDAFNEYLRLGIVEQIPDSELGRVPHFYLPHSGVIKGSEKNTKIRIVFDGSAKSSNGLSLNDCLMTGPNLQNDIFDILSRFRTHQIVISCDIEKMFLQIKVEKSDQDFQRLLWRDSENQPIKQYRLTRLVFGLTNSPYAAMRCIRQIADEVAESDPKLSDVLRFDIFMDDILCGANNLGDAIQLREKLSNTLGKHCFTLAKWVSNDLRVLHNPIFSKRDPVALDFENPQTAKVLGLCWNPKTDTLFYRVQRPDITETLTKRIILSTIAKLYDPVGLIGPVIIKAKIFMQRLWSLGLDWDQIVPVEVRQAWEKYVNELEHINTLQIQRKILRDLDSENDLIAFCDASLQAYGAVIYLRNKSKDGRVNINLICSKTRVSPVKVVTLPRLELCAALLAARLVEKVTKALKISVVKRYYFSDSTIALHYIKSESNLWQVFVANRVAQIQRLSDISDWHHVATEHNPADLVSRGAFARELKESRLYWHGPEFLANDKSLWPCINLVTLTDSEIPDRRNIVLIATTVQELSALTKFSSFNKLQRVIAYVLRFINNVKRNNNRALGHLSINELRKAHDVIIKLVQSQAFHSEILELSHQRPLPKQSKLKSLDPFIDSKGILRVGGRLRESSLKYECKYPAFLPQRHHVSKLLIQAEHLSLLHAGPTQTMFALRTRYWILNAKSEIRKIIHSCIRCFRISPKMIEQKMGNLPRDRLEPCRPFSKVGIDYIGPLYIKDGSKRSKRKVKAWVALFVCMVTRAVHLELVTDLTSECFINSLKRLIARRGKISHIYCDNATNFVGAKREIDETYEFIHKNETQENIQPYLYQENITWNFIPPKAPNFGGLWERLVKSVKIHFKKITMNTLLTYEEALTLLVQIEAIINSRPLTPISNDPDNSEILTPGHFLIGSSLRELPEEDVRSIPENRLSRWQRVQQLQQHFWNRFRREVVTQLQQRAKWRHSPPGELKPGMLVLLSEEAPPTTWRTGRIEQLFPGRDGVPRVASVRTTSGVYRRSVRHLALLPIDATDESVVSRSD